MINRLILIIIIVVFNFHEINAQPEAVSIEIHPDSLKTSGIVTFHCTISNPTNKNYKYFGYASDWEKQIYPQFWEILIKKDTSSYLDCTWQLVLIHRIEGPYIKLLKHSSNKFDFKLNFSKLCKWSDLSRLFYPGQIEKPRVEKYPHSTPFLTADP